MTINVNIDERALTEIRNFLDAAMYALVDFRLSLEAPLSPTGFPRFDQLSKVVDRLDPSTRAIFRLLRLGETVALTELEGSSISALLGSFRGAGLLVDAENGGLRTPDLLLVPIEGLYLFVSTPPSYPTATRAADVWFDLSSYVLGKSHPTLLDGLTVLDLCCGSGVQSLLCAKRGAREVLGLDISRSAVQIAELNAMLNGLADICEFRESDAMAAIADDRIFDFVICNTPYAPVVGDRTTDLSVDDIGNYVLFAMLDELPRAMGPHSHALLAAWRSPGVGGQTGQLARVTERMSRKGFSTTAFVERAADTKEGVLKILTEDATNLFGTERAHVIATRATELFASSSIDGFYNQLIRCDPTNTKTTVFGLDLTHESGNS